MCIIAPLILDFSDRIKHQRKYNDNAPEITGNKTSNNNNTIRNYRGTWMVNIQYENINILFCYLQHTYLIKPISSYNHVSYYTIRIRCILFYSIRGMIPRIDAIYTCANKLRINLLFIYVYWSSIYTHIMPSRHMWALNDYFERE